MKKLLCLIIAIAAVICFAGAAYAAGMPSFEVSTVEALPGETVTVDINIVNNPGIASFELYIIYDDDVLEWTDVQHGSWPGNWDTAVGEAITWFNNGNVAEDGILATLTFRIKDSAPAGRSTVSVTYREHDVYDYDENDVYFDITEGGVTVGGTHEHTWGAPQWAWVDDLSTASVTFSCRCGESLTVSAAVSKEGTEATCTEPGEAVYTASVELDGITFTDVKTMIADPKGHTEDEAVRENEDPPTCVSEGSYDLVVYCSVCGEELSREIVTLPMSEHVPEASASIEDLTEATCTENGHYNEVIYCSVCGEELERTSVTIPSPGHQWLDWVIIVEADAMHDGEAEHTCSVCGITEKEIIPATGHDIPAFQVSSAEAQPGETVTLSVSAVNNPGIASFELYIVYDIDVLEWIDVQQGTWPGNWDVAVGQTVTWFNNGDISEDGVIATVMFRVKDDAPSGKTPVRATYREHNVYDYDENDVYFDIIEGGVIVGGLHEHTWGDPQWTWGDDLSTASVTFICGCGESLTVQAAVSEDGTEATCTEPGEAVFTASVIMDETAYTDVKSVIIEPKGHTEDEAVTENEDPATCASEGSYDLVVYCSVCGEELSRETVTLPKPEHVPESSAVIEDLTEATCTVDGYYDEVIYCSVCGEELERTSVTIPAAGHQWLDWVIITEADATHEGEKEHTCSVCGTTEKHLIPALGGSPSFQVSEAEALPGETVTLTVSVVDNPGIASFELNVEYDQNVLEWTGISQGAWPGNWDVAVGEAITWFNNGNMADDGVIATLTFLVKEEAPSGRTVVRVTYREDDVYDYDENNVYFDTIEGGVVVGSSASILWGDANGDGKVDSKDVVLLKRYLANYDYDTGTSTVEIYPGGDANGDGKVDSKDVVILKRYLANYDYDTGTSTVILGPTN